MQAVALLYLCSRCAEALAASVDAAVLPCLLYASTAMEDSAARLKNRWLLFFELAACKPLASSASAGARLKTRVTHHFSGSKDILQQPGSHIARTRTRTGKASATSEQTQSASGSSQRVAQQYRRSISIIAGGCTNRAIKKTRWPTKLPTARSRTMRTGAQE